MMTITRYLETGALLLAKLNWDLNVMERLQSVMLSVEMESLRVLRLVMTGMSRVLMVALKHALLRISSHVRKNLQYVSHVRMESKKERKIAMTETLKEAMDVIRIVS